MGRWPDLKSPQEFDQKLLWLNLYWHHPLKAECGDKYTMHGYVKKHGFEHLLPELLGVYENSRQIDFSALPERFVLKCTHGCKYNIFCKDKKQLNVAAVRKQLDTWLKKDYSKVDGETHYRDMQRRIICEPFLDDLSGGEMIDYKLYCFNGKFHCTLVCIDRVQYGNAQEYFFDRNWEKMSLSYPGLFTDRVIPRPESYREMIACAEELSKPFPFVRVDFYDIKGRALLGEMTFTPAGCIDPSYTETGQNELGALIKLPEKLLS